MTVKEGELKVCNLETFPYTVIRFMSVTALEGNQHCCYGNCTHAIDAVGNVLQVTFFNRYGLLRKCDTSELSRCEQVRMFDYAKCVLRC